VIVLVGLKNDCNCEREGGKARKRNNNKGKYRYIFHTRTHIYIYEYIGIYIYNLYSILFRYLWLFADLGGFIDAPHFFSSWMFLVCLQHLFTMVNGYILMFLNLFLLGWTAIFFCR
jgi:hypothetical protein